MAFQLLVGCAASGVGLDIPAKQRKFQTSSCGSGAGCSITNGKLSAVCERRVQLDGFRAVLRQKRNILMHPRHPR